jgi:uncharacterized lipoprotein YmbA
MMRKLGGALMLAGLLSACGTSPPSHYFVLSAQPDPAPAGTAVAVRTVALGAVRLPEALDRPEMARRLGPNQLEYAETDRWAGPLDDMVRRILASDLQPLLPPGTVVVSADSATPADATVAVNITRFDADKAGRVTLHASWEILDKNARVVSPPRAVGVVLPAAGADAAAVAATMSRAVAGLADNIAAGLGGDGVAAMR